MNGSLFFFVFLFYTSCVIGYIFKNYINTLIDINYVVLKGPWDVNVGCLMVFTFLLYIIFKKIYKGNNICLLRILYDAVAVSVMSFVLKFILSVEFSFNLFSSIYISYFTLLPILYIFMSWCSSLFSNCKYRNEQNLLLFVICVVSVILIGDVVFFVLNKLG